MNFDKDARSTFNALQTLYYTNNIVTENSVLTIKPRYVTINIRHISHLLGKLSKYSLDT